MNRNLYLLTLCQGLFLTNNVVFIAINGLVGLALAPVGWLATLPVMGYVVGGALSTSLVARSQRRWGRQRAFQAGLGVAMVSALLCAAAALTRSFWLLCLSTALAGYYNANAHLYRFVAAELAAASAREKAVSLVMAGGLIGAVLGPNLASWTRELMPVPFAGAYVALALVAALALVLMTFIRFPATEGPAVNGKGSGHPASAGAATALPAAGAAAALPNAGRPLSQIVRQPVFLVAAATGALSYGVMNLLMAATPLAMQQCGLPFSDAAWVLEWHVIGMFAPGFFTGHLLKRFGAPRVMAVGVALYVLCIAIALSGMELQQFVWALLLLGVGWNFLFTGSTMMSLSTYAPEERDRAQGALNFCVFATLAVSSLASGVLVTTQGWALLNWGSLVPVALCAVALGWLTWHQRKGRPAAA